MSTDATHKPITIDAEEEPEKEQLKEHPLENILELQSPKEELTYTREAEGFSLKQITLKVNHIFNPQEQTRTKV